MTSVGSFAPPESVPVQVVVEGQQQYKPITQSSLGVPSFAGFAAAESALEKAFTPEEIATIEARLQALAVANGTAGTTEGAAVEATPTPEPQDPNCPRDPQHPLYCIYTVKSGDTLSVIAKEYGLTSSGSLSAAEMLAHSNKPEVVDSDDIRPGQKLRVPISNGIIHTAFVSESLSEVAEAYGVSVEEIRALSANSVGNTLNIGQEILIPNPSDVPAQAAAASPTPSPTPTATKTPAATATPEPEPTMSVAEAAADDEPVEEDEPVDTANTLAPPPIIVATATATPVPATATPTRAPATATPTPSAAARSSQPASKTAFIWPVGGPVSSYMGPSHPLGIDIDLFANEGVPVGAAAAGTVTFAGGNPCCSYGYYVIVDHGNGITTLYAHFSKIAVKEGQKVSQGQTVGYGGSTGYATGTHLHFEMRLNGNVVDPLLYLPK